MKTARLALALAAINLVVLALWFTRTRPAEASPELGILRGTGLQIVAAQGRTRASIELLPANPTFAMPDGSKGYPETVIVRLSTADGKPRVKLTTSERGSGLMLLGDSDDTYTLVHAD